MTLPDSPKTAINNIEKKDNPATLVDKFLKHPFVSVILSKLGITWRAEYAYARELDAVFVKPGVTDFDEAAGVTGLFGSGRFVGMVVSNLAEFAATVDRLVRDHQVGPWLAQRFKVAILTPEDFPLYAAFFSAVQDAEKQSPGSSRFLNSGLERAWPINIQDYLDKLTLLFQRNRGDFAAWGVSVDDREGEGGLDIVFRGDDGSPTGVPLRHLRQGIVDGPFLREPVLDGTRPVIGFVVRRVGESKREAYARAEAVKQVWRARTGIGDLEVPVVSDGQLSLWSKLGLFEVEGTQIAGTGLTIDDLARVLFFDNGPLARLGMSLPGARLGLEGQRVDRMDMVFFARGQDGVRRHAMVPVPFAGMKFNGDLEWDGEKIQSVGNVIGIIVVPDSWTKEQIDTYVAPARDFVRTHFFREAEILVVTPALLELWKNRGSPLFSLETVVAERVRVTETTYGSTGGSGTNYYFEATGPAKIGGDFAGLVQSDGKDRWIAMLEMGKNYDGPPAAYSEITATSTTVAGLIRDLAIGAIPPIPALYALAYIVTGLREHPEAATIGASWPIGYSLAEIATRDPERIVEIGDTSGETLQISEVMGGKWWSGIRTRVSAFFASHPHQDHIGNAPLLAEGVPVISSPPVLGIIRAIDVAAKTWRGRTGVVTRIDLPRVGRAYATEPRLLRPLLPGETTVLLPGLAAQVLPVDHSTLAIARRIYPVDAPDQSFIHTGDLRIGTRGRTERMVAQWEGLAQTVVVDATKFVSEPKTGLPQPTREMLLSSNEKVLRTTDHPVVLAISRVDAEGVIDFINLARTLGWTVGVDPRHALVLHQLQAMADEFQDEDIGMMLGAVPVIGRDYQLWRRMVTKEDPYRRALAYLVGEEGIIEPADVGGRMAIIVGGSELLNSTLLKIPKGPVSAIYNTPYPYGQFAKHLAVANFAEIERRGGENYADFAPVGRHRSRVDRKPDRVFHLSGHIPDARTAMEKVVLPLFGGSLSGKILVLTHTATPGISRDHILDAIARLGGEIAKMGRGTKKPFRVRYRRVRGDSDSDPRDPTNPLGIKAGVVPLWQ